MLDHSLEGSNSNRSFWALCDAFSTHCEQRRQAYAGHTRYLLRTHIRSASIAHLPAHLVTAEQIATLLKDTADRDGEKVAGQLRSRLHRAFEFGLDRRAAKIAVDSRAEAQGYTAFADLRANPVLAIAQMRAAQPHQRLRILSELELANVLQQLEEGLAGHPAHALGCRILQFNIGLGMQRGAPLLNMERRHILRTDTGEVSLRLASKCRHVSHLVPVCGRALQQLQWFERRSCEMDSPWLFPSRSAATPLPQEIMYRAILLISQELVGKHRIEDAFNVSDLRRTAQDMLQANGTTAARVAALQDILLEPRDKFGVPLPLLRLELQGWQDWLMQLQTRR